jgi:hypothetical protein
VAQGFLSSPLCRLHSKNRLETGGDSGDNGTTHAAHRPAIDAACWRRPGVISASCARPRAPRHSIRPAPLARRRMFAGTAIAEFVVGRRLATFPAESRSVTSSRAVPNLTRFPRPGPRPFSSRYITAPTSRRMVECRIHPRRNIPPVAVLVRWTCGIDPTARQVVASGVARIRRGRERAASGLAKRSISSHRR